MPRSQASKPSADVSLPKKRGPDSWLRGTKLKFLMSLEDEWKVAHNAGPATVGVFYDRVTTQWIYMYGYTLPLEEDNPNHDQPPQTGLEKIPFLENQPAAVVASRTVYWQELRRVRFETCIVFILLTAIQKLARWFYGQKNIKKSEVASGIEGLFSLIHSTTSKPSRKLSPYQYYQSHYWDTRIAPYIPPALEAAYKDAISKGEALTPEVKKSIRMRIQQNVSKECWNKEDTTFKVQVQAEFEESNSKTNDRNAKLCDQPKSAEDYDQYVFFLS